MEVAMADQSSYRTPRWVLVTGIIVLGLAILVSIVLLTGIGGEHGPGRHLPSGDLAGHTLAIAW
jgi:hypothetical protein